MSADCPPPPHHPTADEVAQRVEYTANLVAAGHHKCTIKARLRKKFGLNDASTLERYITLARDKITLELAQARMTWRAEILAGYKREVRIAEKARDRLKARELIVKLLALELRPDLVAADDMRDMLTYDPDATREPAGPLPGTDAGSDGSPGDGADALPSVGD